MSESNAKTLESFTEPSLSAGPSAARDDNHVDLHIAFGVDSKFVPAMGACMNSILNHNQDLSLRFHVVTHSLSHSAAEQIDAFAARRGISIRIHRISEERLAILPAPTPPMSYATYLRLLIPDMLKGIVDRVLYVDADIVCLGALKEMVRFPLDGNVLAAVPEGFKKVHRRDLIGIPASASYFNAGVLYIDVEQWNAYDLTLQLIEALKESNCAFPLADQDAINKVLYGQIKPIERRWNFAFDQHGPAGDAVFYHYTYLKPWQYWSDNFRDRNFLTALAETPWEGWEDRSPKTRGHKTRQAQKLLRTGHIIAGIHWHLQAMRTPRAGTPKTALSTPPDTLGKTA